MYKRTLVSSIVAASLFLLACATFRPPTLLEEIEPEYPHEALEEGLEGSVSLYILVSDKGDVKIARINESSGHKILDDAAIQYAMSLKFDPARKGGKPTGVMLTWLVTYKAVATYFLPKEYVDRVSELIQLADQFAGEEKSRVLQEILYAHEEYAQHMTENPELNYNEFIQRFVNPEVYDQWKDLWADWPLRFAVFHDFVLRYPDSDEVAYATARMLDLIKEDIGLIKEAAQYRTQIRRREDLFLKSIYTLLSEQYPQALTDELRQDAEKYLGRQ